MAVADKTQLEACCETWRLAQESGSDNEGYGKLVYLRDERLVIGHDLPPVCFCPWCGAKKWDRRRWNELPLGTRFRYLGGADIWVKIENGGCGVIAKWEGVTRSRVLQEICSLAETEDECRACVVEVIE